MHQSSIDANLDTLLGGAIMAYLKVFSAKAHRFTLCTKSGRRRALGSAG